MFNQPKRILYSGLAAVILSLSVPATAQETLVKDPARWSIEDTTPKARYQTLKKEADAAQRENLKQCKAMAANEKKECMKEAKTLYQQDLARAKQALKE